MKEVSYLVQIAYGGSHDWSYMDVFVTDDKAKADNWKEKYDRIVEENKERVSKYWTNEDYVEGEPFCSEFIHFQNPKAMITEIEKR